MGVKGGMTGKKMITPSYILCSDAPPLYKKFLSDPSTFFNGIARRPPSITLLCRVRVAKVNTYGNLQNDRKHVSDLM